MKIFFGLWLKKIIIKCPYRPFGNVFVGEYTVTVTSAGIIINAAKTKRSPLVWYKHACLCTD